MTMMAMAHPRRYFSLRAVGAMPFRLAPTPPRRYPSSVSDPLANPSKTSSAASSVASGRWFIICSTAVQERRVMRSPSKSGPRVSRNGSDRQDVGPHPSPSAGDGVLASILGRHADHRRAVQRRSERVGGPRPGRHDRDAPGARHHRRDAREERVHLVARDEEGERSRQVAPVAGEPEAPARDARALDQVIREVAERVHARRARRAGGTGALETTTSSSKARVSIMPNADRGGRHETGGPGRSRRRAAAFDRRVRAYGDGWATSSPMT